MMTEVSGILVPAASPGIAQKFGFSHEIRRYFSALARTKLNIPINQSLTETHVKFDIIGTANKRGQKLEKNRTGTALSAHLNGQNTQTQAESIAKRIGVNPIQLESHRVREKSGRLKQTSARLLLRHR